MIDLPEIDGAYFAAEVRNDQHILRRQQRLLPLGVVHDHDAAQLTGDRHEVGQFGARIERRSNIDRDEDVGTHALHHVHRQVVDDAAVHQQVTLEIDRREQARNRHAGAHRGGEVALRNDHRLAGDDVGRNRAERNRQLVEVLRLNAIARGRLQEKLDLLAADRAARQQRRLRTHAEFRSEQREVVVALAPIRALGADRVVGEDVRPVQLPDLFFELVRRHTGCVQTADDRTHAGAGHVVDRNPQLFEYPDHADVRDAARAAAAKHESDARSIGRRRFAQVIGVRRNRLNDRDENSCESGEGSPRTCGAKKHADVSGRGFAQAIGGVLQATGSLTVAFRPFNEGMLLPCRSSSDKTVRLNRNGWTR